MQTDSANLDVYLGQLSAQVRQLTKNSEFIDRMAGPLGWTLCDTPTPEAISMYTWLCAVLGYTKETAPPFHAARSVVVAVQLLIERNRIIRLRELREGATVSFTNDLRTTYRVLRIRSTLLLDLGTSYPQVYPHWVQVVRQ